MRGSQQAISGLAQRATAARPACLAALVSGRDTASQRPREAGLFSCPQRRPLSSLAGHRSAGLSALAVGDVPVIQEQIAAVGFQSVFPFLCRYSCCLQLSLELSLVRSASPFILRACLPHPQGRKAGDSVCVRGWVRSVRASKDHVFLAVNDGSNLAGMQVVYGVGQDTGDVAAAVAKLDAVKK